MLKLRTWRDRRKAKLALLGYPVYSPPYLQNEIDLPLSKAEANFGYFMTHRAFRLRSLQEFLNKFDVTASTDDQGLAAVTNWFRRYGGLMTYFERRSTVTLDAFVNYDPTWTEAHIGINVVWDLGIYTGECVIARYPSAHWTINTGNPDPISLKALGFHRPSVAGLYWPTECDPITQVFIDSQSIAQTVHGVGGHRVTRAGNLSGAVETWSKAKAH